VPKAGYEDKVFYVWFDAPIGYISITACAGDEKGFDWKYWWQRPDEVELFQFIGKDNIPFHTVIFPSSLLGSGKKWTMLHHMSSTEFLTFEGEKISKSKGIGVFGNDVIETGVPADVWRFFIYYNRPEKGDYNFTWSELQDKVNGELIGNLGNLANRTLTFASRYFGGVIPALPSTSCESEYRNKVLEIEKRATAHLERAELRDAFRAAFELSDISNKRFQAAEPWKTRISDPAAAEALIGELCYVLRDLAIMIHPYMPQAAAKLASFFGQSIGGPGGLSWSDLGGLSGLRTVSTPEVLFSKLEDDFIATLRERYSGSQKERQMRDEGSQKERAEPAPALPGAIALGGAPSAAPKPKAEHVPTPPPLPDLPLEERFEKLVDLRVAKIVKIERHPKADKLYVETLDDGSGMERVIVSGLVPFYKEEELLGKSIVLVNNLKSAKLRGVESRGMLLAASRKVEVPGGSAVKEAVEVLDAGDAAPGTRICLEGRALPGEVGEIDVDAFFSVPIVAKGGSAYVGAYRLVAGGAPFALAKVPEGEVG
jgi:methionyl-tRNA synthetase